MLARLLRFFARRALACLLGVSFSLFITTAPPTCGDELASQTQPTFSLSAPPKTQLHLITDDDFLFGTATPWCQRSLERAIDQCEAARTNSDIEVRFIPAGSPGILNKSRPKTGPRRAICLITDSQGLVYAFCVGVPTGSQLISLFEDADELLLFKSMSRIDQAVDPEAETENALVKVVQERSAKRTIRHYRPLLEEIRDNSDVLTAAEMLAPVVQLDLGERFHLTPPIDGDRLTATQQHVESCRYWCDAMLPSMIGKPIDAVWPQLASAVWNAKPWRIENGSESLVSWYEATINNGPIVIDIASKTDMAYLGVAQSHVTENPKAVEKRISADAELESKLAEFSEYRKFTLPELAALLAHRNDSPIDILIGASAKSRWWAINTNTRESITFPAGAGDRLFTQVERWAAE